MNPLGMFGISVNGWTIAGGVVCLMALGLGWLILKAIYGPVIAQVPEGEDPFEWYESMVANRPKANKPRVLMISAAIFMLLTGCGIMYWGWL